MGKRIDHTWDPNSGDQLIGVVTDAMIVNTNTYGDIDVAIVTEEGTDTKIGVWLSRKTLVTLFERLRPTLGAEIVITYSGTATSKTTGRSYHTYLMDVSESMEATGRDWIEDFKDELDKAEHTRPEMAG
ncbi:MAG: hypothetical protein M3132_05330 [Actinomycetia bacterium]|nr:hypothetical protein [Actinomycetes bacterium]